MPDPYRSSGFSWSRPDLAITHVSPAGPWTWQRVQVRCLTLAGKAVLKSLDNKDLFLHDTDLLPESPIRPSRQLGSPMSCPQFWRRMSIWRLAIRL